MAQLAEFPVKRCNTDGLRRIQKVKCSGKTLQAMVGMGRFVLVGRRGGAAVRIVKAKLREREIGKDRGLGELGSSDVLEQRLDDQRIDRNRDNQPSPK